MAADRNGRIQVVINGLSARRGGVETYLINLLHFMPDDSPIDVFLLAPEALPLPPERENFRKIHVNWPVENPFVRAAWESICLPGLIKDLHADLLFCPGGIIGARLPSGCRTVAMSRNMLPFDREQRRKYPPGYMRTRLWILRRILLRDMLRADLVIFISEFARNAIQSCAQRRLANTVVIPHGISPEFRNGGSPELPRPNCLPAGEYLLYVSDLSFYKSQVEVVQAYALLKQHRHTPEKLVLAGYETKDYGRLVRSEIHRLASEGLPMMNLQLDGFLDQQVCILKISNNLANPWNEWLKHMFDLAFAGILAVITLPVMAVIALLVRLDSHGPALLRQERIGRAEKPFACLKFRTMHLDGDERLARCFADHPHMAEEWGKYAKLRSGDPRLTRIGRVLRRWSLDELPQIFNVLSGEMSLVGPRPYLARERERIGPHFTTILTARPGMTGFWQVSGKNKVTFDDRVRLEVWYVRNWSLWFDFIILAKTFGAIVRADHS
jgi:lipopolysaccharide/colanic/teichoic acid biosynthesis glycosyltransferase